MWKEYFGAYFLLSATHDTNGFGIVSRIGSWLCVSMRFLFPKGKLAHANR